MPARDDAERGPASSGQTGRPAKGPTILSAVLENDRWGFIDRDGRHAFDGRWPLVRNFSSGLAAINVGGQRGQVPDAVIGGHFEYIDASGQTVIKGPFPNPGIFFHGTLVTLLDDGDAVVVNPSGDIVARGFGDLHGFYGGLSYAVKGDKAGFVSPDGTWKFELPRAARVGAFHEGKVAFSPDGTRWGYLDEQGKTIIEPTFEQAGQFWQDRAPVATGGKWGYIDGAGKRVAPAEWDDALPCLEDRCAVARGDRWGYVDLAGKVVIEPRYEALRDFHEGVAAVLSEGKVGYLDKDGAWAIEPRFTAAYDFHFGRAAFVSGDRVGFLDRTGKTVIEPRFTRANRFVDVERSNDTDRSE